MKVRALREFNDLQSKTLRKFREEFEVSHKRLEEIISSHKEALIEVIEDEIEDTEEKIIKKKTTKK